MVDSDMNYILPCSSLDDSCEELNSLTVADRNANFYLFKEKIINSSFNKHTDPLLLLDQKRNQLSRNDVRNDAKKKREAFCKIKEVKTETDRNELVDYCASSSLPDVVFSSKMMRTSGSDSPDVVESLKYSNNDDVFDNVISFNQSSVMLAEEKGTYQKSSCYGTVGKVSRDSQQEKSQSLLSDMSKCFEDEGRGTFSSEQQSVNVSGSCDLSLCYNSKDCVDHLKFKDIPNLSIFSKSSTQFLEADISDTEGQTVESCKIPNLDELLSNDSRSFCIRSNESLDDEAKQSPDLYGASIGKYFDDMEFTEYWANNQELSPETQLKYFTPSSRLELSKGQGVNSDDSSHVDQIFNFDFEQSENSMENLSSAELEKHRGENVAELEKAARCLYRNKCLDASCERGIKKLKEFVEEIENFGCESKRSFLQTLDCLCCHSDRCDELQCPLPFCAQLNSLEDLSIKKIVAMLRRVNSEDLDISKLVGHPCVNMSSTDVISDEVFHKIVPLFKISPHTSVCTGLQKNEHFVIKEIRFFHSDHKETVKNIYDALKLVHHPNISEMEWLVLTPDVWYLAMNFESGGNLYEALQTRRPLDLMCVKSYMKQLFRAVNHLHQLKILFLAWSSWNIVMDYCETIKLTNFSAGSLLYNTEVNDIGLVKMLLFPTIIPPEILRHSAGCLRLQPSTDMWGLCCLYNELITGMVVWSELIHEDRDDIWRKIKKEPIPHVPDSLESSQRKILEIGWQVLPSERGTVDDLVRGIQDLNSS